LWFLSSFIRSFIYARTLDVDIMFGIVMLYGKNVIVSTILFANVF